MTTPLLLPAKIKELRKALPDHPHRNYVGPGGTTSSLDTVGASWVSMLRPYLWERLETKHSYSAYRDLGYGNIALFKRDELIGVTDRPILAIKGHPVLLDKEYYGIDKYIWR